MAVTVVSFKAKFPEFVDAGDPLITLKLAQAVRDVAPSSWGTSTDDGIELTTAHLLALSPFGQKVRLSKNDKTSIYLDELKRQKKRHAMGRGRVI